MEYSKQTHLLYRAMADIILASWQPSLPKSIPESRKMRHKARHFAARCEPSLQTTYSDRAEILLG